MYTAKKFPGMEGAFMYLFVERFIKHYPFRVDAAVMLVGRPRYQDPHTKGHSRAEAAEPSTDAGRAYGHRLR